MINRRPRTLLERSLAFNHSVNIFKDEQMWKNWDRPHRISTEDSGLWKTYGGRKGVNKADAIHCFKLKLKRPSHSLQLKYVAVTMISSLHHKYLFSAFTALLLFNTIDSNFQCQKEYPSAEIFWLLKFCVMSLVLLIDFTINASLELLSLLFLVLLL